MKKSKFKIQEEQYQIPRHHLVTLDKKKFGLHQQLSWGLEYYAYATEIIKEVIKLKPKNVADVGCGDGKILCELSKILKKSVLDGYDLSNKAILFAKAFSNEIKNLNFYCEDFKESKIQYDVIICMEVLEHIPDKEIMSFVKILSNKLKNNGKLIISVPSKNVPLHIKHYRHYDLDLLKKQSRDYFEIEKSYFVHKRNKIYRLMNILLTNRIFILANSFLIRIILSVYNKFLRFAKPSNGSHLIVILKKKD